MQLRRFGSAQLGFVCSPSPPGVARSSWVVRSFRHSWLFICMTSVVCRPSIGGVPATALAPAQHLQDMQMRRGLTSRGSKLQGCRLLSMTGSLREDRLYPGSRPFREAHAASLATGVVEASAGPAPVSIQVAGHGWPMAARGSLCLLVLRQKMAVANKTCPRRMVHSVPPVHGSCPCIRVASKSSASRPCFGQTVIRQSSAGRPGHGGARVGAQSRKPMSLAGAKVSKPRAARLWLFGDVPRKFQAKV